MSEIFPNAPCLCQPDVLILLLLTLFSSLYALLAPLPTFSTWAMKLCGFSFSQFIPISYDTKLCNTITDVFAKMDFSELSLEFTTLLCFLALVFLQWNMSQWSDCVRKLC